MKKIAVLLILIVILTLCLTACDSGMYFSKKEVDEILLEEFDEVIDRFPLSVSNAFTEPDEFPHGGSLYVGKKDGEEKFFAIPCMRKEKDLARKVEWPLNALFLEIAEQLKILNEDDEDMQEYDYIFMIYSGDEANYAYKNVEELDLPIVIIYGMHIAVQIDGEIIYKNRQT